MKTNLRLKAIILEVVENQLRDSSIPETKETFSRLIASGYDEQTVKEMIGAVVVDDLYYILKDKKEFDKEKYVEKLRKLK